jgi:PAS domain S-box-containing protein
MRRSGQLSSASGGAPAIRRIPSALLTFVVLIGGALLTWVAARAALDAEKQRARAELTLQASDIQSAIQDRLLAYEALLRAGIGVVDAFWPPRPEHWQRFTAQLRLATVYPGIQGIGFAARVDTVVEFERWSAALRPLGANDLSRWTHPGGRLPQTAIVFLEPLESSNRLALGFDMMSEPRRRAAMERARDTGAVALSPKVVLVQDLRRGANAAGFLLYVPAYAPRTLPETVEERRQALRGFVYSPFRAEDFFSSSLEPVGEEVVVEVFDGGIPRTDTLLYRSRPGEVHAPLTDTRQLQLAGHEWTLRVSSTRTFASNSRDPIVWIVLGGASTTLLLAGLAYALALNRQRLQERIRADQALAQREQQAALVLENALDAYIAIDTTDRIVEWNRQAATLFGWTAHEAIGRRLTDTIVPPDLRTGHLNAITGFAARTEHPLLGKRLEMPARCRDGTELFVELSIVQIATPAGLRFAASLRDITQKRRQAAEIQLLNETLEQRVAERTLQLEAANRDLSSANRDLEAFAYSVSHDLRAPLRAIDGHVQRFLDNPGPPEQQRHHAGAIRRNVAHMSQLIDDLLNFALIGRRPLQKQPVVLWVIVRNVLHELPHSPSVVFEVSPDELGLVQADAALLKQAISNLVANALKFSRNVPTPRVRIGSERGPNGKAYYVRDNGVGFDMQHAGKLFGVFERLHKADEFEGSGVGLAIVKHIIERHGGKVWAEAEPGRGATFFFTLP